MDLEELKRRLGYTDDNPVRDAKLALDLEDAIDYTKEWCNNDFRGGIPPGVKRGLTLLVHSLEEDQKGQEVQSQRLGDMSKSFYPSGALGKAHTFFRPWKRVRFT